MDGGSVRLIYVNPISPLCRSNTLLIKIDAIAIYCVFNAWWLLLFASWWVEDGVAANATTTCCVVVNPMGGRG